MVRWALAAGELSPPEHPAAATATSPIAKIKSRREVMRRAASRLSCQSA